MDASEAVFQRVKGLLMETNANGESVYDVLYRVMYAMLDENPLQVAEHPERLAEVVAELQRTSFSYGDSSQATAQPSAVHFSQAESAEKHLALFVQPPPKVVTTIEQPTPYTTVTTTTVEPVKLPRVRSVSRDNSWWSFAGVGLPQREAFLLDQSIMKLVREKNLEDVRFFGKIFGTTGNYLVLTSKRYVPDGETVYQEVNTTTKPVRKGVEVPVQSEPAFKGCNRLSFWVAPNVASPWTLLPDVTPRDIATARHVCRYFTGDLDAPVVTHPHFEGTERTYLRAQLQRILSATFIAPSGALEKVEVEAEEDDEDDEEKKNQPKKAVYLPLTAESKDYNPDVEAGVAALVDLEQWVHSEAHIFKNGRQTSIPPRPQAEEEDQEEEEEETKEEEEEEKELFLPIKRDTLFGVVNIPKEPNPEEEEEEEPVDDKEEAEDEEQPEEDPKPLEDDDVADDDPLKMKLTSWIASLVNAFYKRHGVCVIKSLRWPGAVAFAAEGGVNWGCVYLGNGLKASDNAFAPLKAPAIQSEAPDIFEAADPTAAVEKLVRRGEEIPPERDSEDEKDEEAEEDE